MMSCTFSLFSLQVLEKCESEVLDFWIFQNWLFWTGIRLVVTNMQEFLYVRIFIGI